MWNKVSRRKCLKLSCYKPEEHPFRISALEICQDADPIPQEWEDSRAQLALGNLDSPGLIDFRQTLLLNTWYLFFMFFHLVFVF